MPSFGVFSQGSPAKLFLPTRAVQGATITTGYAVAFALGGNSVDGVSGVLPASGTLPNLPGFIGVAERDIADAGFGLVQAFGFAASVRFSAKGTSVTINAGDPLVPGAEAGALTSSVPTYAKSGFKYISASNVPAAISASGYMSGIVRCL